MPEEFNEKPDYGVTVRLVNKESGLFYVMGEVNAAGPIRWSQMKRCSTP